MFRCWELLAALKEAGLPWLRDDVFLATCANKTDQAEMRQGDDIFLALQKLCMSRFMCMCKCVHACRGTMTISGVLPQEPPPSFWCFETGRLHYVVQARLKHLAMIRPLPQPPMFWGYRYKHPWKSWGHGP